MRLDEVKKFLGKDWEDVQKLIADSLDSEIELLAQTNKGILSHGGKQLRPVLGLLIARACNGGKTNSDTIKYSAASELLHNATLLHDDVADASEERRGGPTINSLMGPSISVLVGDYWLVKAMECVLAAHTSQHGTKLFANTLLNLAEGEMLQLQKAEKGDTGEEDYLKIIFNKTASLFDAVAFSACLSVGASAEVRASMRQYAVKLGCAFQMRDDIFDYQDNADVGKPVGVDILEKKITLPLLGAFANAPQEEERYRKLLSGNEDVAPFHQEILQYVRDNGGLEYAQTRLEEYISEAISSLDILEESEEKSILRQLAEYVGDREI